MEKRKIAKKCGLLILNLGFLNFVFLSFSFLFANNLDISQGSLVSQSKSAGTASVKLSLSWDNSWRDHLNYDAVWIFLKYSSDSGQTWEHGFLPAAGRNPPGFSAGRGTQVEIIAAGDKKGCFVQRSTSGQGRVEVEDLVLVWDYAAGGLSPEDLKEVDLKIFGIEMVYIPKGSFYAGDALPGNPGGRFSRGSESYQPWYVNSELAIQVSDVESGGYYYRSAGNEGEDSDGAEFVVADSFPKGYQAFYLMKYEISQGQYADFLNTLTASQAVNRFPGENGNYRQTIDYQNGVYFAARPDRAANFLSWPDLCAFLAWAGLRPLTELEYEKAARGRDIYPVAGAFAWGGNQIVPALTLSQPEDGKEVILNSGANANYGQQVFEGGDGGQGPLRGGIFAFSGSGRAEAGSSYYGVMELSGNVWERAVTLGNASGRAFQGSQGQGFLTPQGKAPNSDWPGYSPGEGVSGALGSGFRGGSWQNLDSESLTVSYRGKAAFADFNRRPDAGGRGIRRLDY